MKKLILLLLIVHGTWHIAKGQAARSTSSQYIFNALSINPAYAGSQFVSSLDMSYFGNGEEFVFLYRTVDATWHGPMDLQGRKNLGLELNFVHEGEVDEVRFNPSFTYRLETDVGKIAFGGTVGFNYFSIDNTNTALFYEPFFTIDGSLGIYFNNDKFFAGLSSLNMFESLITEQKNIGGLFLKRENPFYFYSGFMQRLNDRFSLRPNVLLKFADSYELAEVEESVSNELAFDISASVIMEQNYWVTVFYGSSFFEEIDDLPSDNTIQINHFGLSLHFVVGQLRLKYGIHRSAVQGLGTEFPISHLFGIGYDFGVENESYYRYF